MAVARQLHVVANTTGQVLHELGGVWGVAPTNEPGDDQLGVGVECRPRPSVARALCTASNVQALRLRRFLFLAVENVGRLRYRCVSPAWRTT